MLPGKPHGFRAVSRQRQRNWLRGWIVQSGVQCVELAFVRDLLTRPQLANDLARLDESVPPLTPGRPLSCGGLVCFVSAPSVTQASPECP